MVYAAHAIGSPRAASGVHQRIQLRGPTSSQTTTVTTGVMLWLNTFPMTSMPWLLLPEARSPQ